MDDSIDVDELFADPNSLELGLAAPATVLKGITQRFDELRLLGSCQKIAWSKLGAIAYISQDGSKVCVQAIRCKPEGGAWSLGDEKSFTTIAETQNGRTFVHLCWNENGYDLAIVDSYGQILHASMTISLNTFALSRPMNLDSDDDGNQPVGMMWLSVNRPVNSFHSATKSGEHWTYSRQPRRPLGPFHPSNKSAFVYVTRSGNLRFLYQVQDSKWAGTNVEIQNVSCSDDILTHAALAPAQGGTILLVTHSTQGKLFMYRLQIKWEAAQSSTNQRHQPQAMPPPLIQVVHLTTETTGNIFRKVDDQENEFQVQLSATRVLYCLTHLQILASSADGAEEVSVLAVFSTPVHAWDAQQINQNSSVLVRWSLESGGQTFHSFFNEIPPERPAQHLKHKAKLSKRKELFFDNCILSIDHLEVANVLALTFDDGTTSFLETKEMATFSEMHDISSVSSLAQAGFYLPNIGAATCIAFSPNGCLAVILDKDYELQLRVINRLEDDLQALGQNDLAIAALALAFARACSFDNNSDDILMVVSKNLGPDFRKPYIEEVYNALSFNVDFTNEQEKLMNHPLLQKCASLPASLGFHGQFQQRSFTTLLPYCTLQLRHTSILLIYFLHFHRQSGDVEFFDPDTLQLIYGSINWMLDLGKYMIDDLFEMAATIDTANDEQMNEMYNNFSLLLLFSNMTRGLFKYNFRATRSLPITFQNAPNLPNEHLGLYFKIVRLIEDSPVKLDALEKLLLGIENAVKQTFQAANIGDDDREALERELFIGATVPLVLRPTVVKVLNNILPLIRPDVDLRRLCTWDYRWLAIDDDSMTEAFRRTNEVDMIKKSIVKIHDGGAKPGRRCARCCGFSGDVYTPKSMASFRLLLKTLLIRMCVCGGMWIMENPGSLEGGPAGGWRRA